MTLSKITCIVVALFIFIEGLTISLAPLMLKRAFEETPPRFLKIIGFLEAVFGLLILFLLSKNL